MASLRKKIKKIGRKVLEVHGKVGKVAIPVVSTAASVLVPGLGLATTALARPIQRYALAAGARGDGMRGREARSYARDIVNRTTKYSLIGTGLGTAANLAIFGGSTVFSGFGAASATASSTAGAAVGPTLYASQLYGGAGKIEEKPGGLSINDWVEEVLAGGIGGALGGGSGSGTESGPASGDVNDPGSTRGLVNMGDGASGGGSGWGPILLIGGLLLLASAA